MDLGETALSVVTLSGVVAIITLLTLGTMHEMDHERFLKQNGCQLIHKSETGRYHWVGKLRENEQIFVYECANNVTRTEVH